MISTHKENYTEKAHYTIIYNDMHFRFLVFFICVLLYVVISPLFFIDYSKNLLPSLIADYFLYGEMNTPPLRILALLNMICFLFYKEYYMFFSIGDIYVYDEFLLCKPKIFIFKDKKIYYKDAFVSNIGKKFYIKNISSVLISNSAKSKNLLDMLCSENIFFMISSMCTNDKNEIIDIHAYIMSNINKYKQEDDNISNSL